MYELAAMTRLFNDSIKRFGDQAILRSVEGSDFELPEGCCGDWGGELGALHPEDMAVPFEDGPVGALGAGDLHAFEDFLDLARSAGMAKGDAVTSSPCPDCCWRDCGWRERSVGLGELCKEAPAEGLCLTGDGELDGRGTSRCGPRGLMAEAQLAGGALGMYRAGGNLPGRQRAGVA